MFAPTFSSASQKLSVDLLIDRSRNRVVFAESGPDFPDTLFSFLTLPLGTIIRLLDARSSLGCADNLYASVAALPDRCFQTPACKAMLLSPRNAAGIQCEGLTLRPDDSEHRIYYRCAGRGMSRSCKVSAVPGVRCSCGRTADTPFAVPGVGGGGVADGVFVEGMGSFMISDDLEVKPVSMSDSLSLLNKMGIEDGSVLEKRTVELGRKEILSLLKRALVSMTPLTDVFLEEPDQNADGEKAVITEKIYARGKQQTATTESRRISVKLFLNKDNDMMVYAEAGNDFVDLLVGFLTLPLGSIIKLLEKHSSLGCIDNLYWSVETLSNGNSYIKSDNHKNMLLEPKLAPYFGCSNQLLRIDELVSEITTSCRHCSAPCFHGGAQTGDTSEMNPKLKNSEIDYGGGFAKGMITFMVTDEMVVTPLSPISGVSIINNLVVPISNLEEVEASVGEAEALDLLRACLTSPTPLSEIFSPALLTLFDQRWCGQFPRN